ncbi:interleukin-12 subunit alpha [Salminus brasiliensis]|uniref:interleukin-12 subunit alpha n=1 Tax=Salminus brasiliensis TaxID=930266 RepID=UPI003B830459
MMMVALLCGGALATPLRTTAPPGTSAEICTIHAKSLLVSLKSVVEAALEERRGSDDLFHGFNCTELPATVAPGSQTVSVCQPSQHVTCSGKSSSTFREPECLKHIRGDLQYYHVMLKTYVKSLASKQKSQSIAELTSITDSIQTLQENCPLLAKSEERPITAWESTTPFDDRMDLCKQLKGFHIRAVTINRALGYISVGEYKK